MRLAPRGAVWIIATLLSLAARPAAAQAALEVTVFDEKQPVPGIEVLVENPATAWTGRQVTDTEGRARFAPLSTAGSYSVRVAESAGFYEAKASGLVLRSNFERSVRLTLVAKATVSEAVTVTGESGSTELNAVNAEVSATLDNREIESIAVEGRDLTRVLYRLPNVTQATGFYPEAPNVSINGANSLYTNYVIDGLDNNENFLGGQKFAVPTGLTQQVTVLTSNYSAEFGRTSNGIFNVTTRSGSNAWHGEAAYLTRPGPAIDASSPYPQRDLSGNEVKNGFERQQGAVALGGPIVKDKTFFFLDAEITRDHKDNLLSSPELGVLATVPGDNAFFYGSGKLDQRWNDRWTSSLRVDVGQVSIEQQGGGVEGGVTFPSAGNTQYRDSMLAAGKTFYAGRDFVSETAFQYSRFHWNYADAVNPASPQTTVIGPTGETLAVLGNPGSVFDDVENTIQIQQKVSFRRGRHSFKLGADLVSADFSLVGGGNVNGNYTVVLTQEQVDAVRAQNKGAALDVGDIPSDARVVDYNVELRPAAFGARQNLWGVYAEDQFAATGRLSLTLGLRYDYDSLSKGGSDSGDTNNIAVRLAANYQLDERSVIRAGYGIFFDKVVYSIYSDALQQSSRASGFLSQLQQLINLGILPADTDLLSTTFNGNLSADYPGVDYLHGPTSEEAQARSESTLSLERRILNPNGYPNPMSQQFMLGYQRQFAGGYLFAIDLIHARTDNLPRLFDLNAPAPYPINPEDVVVRTPAQADATRPAPIQPGGARSIIMTQDAGIARYWSASLNMHKDRRSDRYAWRLSYTLSQLDNDTDDINFRAQDSNNFASEYGPSINDRRHVVNAIAWVYPTNGLSLSLAALLQSGQPINRIPDARLWGTTDLNGDGQSYSDAYDGNSDRWPGASRNSDRLPWSYVFDLAAVYDFRLGRTQRIELRADVFNLFNHTNFSGYSNNATQSNQIQIGPPGGPIVEKNAGPPRQFQFGVRWVF